MSVSSISSSSESALIASATGSSSTTDVNGAESVAQLQSQLNNLEQQESTATGSSRQQIQQQIQQVQQQLQKDQAKAQREAHKNQQANQAGSNPPPGTGQYVNTQA